MIGALAGLDGVVCDLDGVVYRGDVPIEGAAGAIEALRSRGVKVVFCTNNSFATVDQYIDKLGVMGVTAGRDKVLTSGVVTAEVLASRGAAGRRSLVVGGEGIRAALRDVGIEIDGGPAPAGADFVVVGIDPGFDYAALRRASDAVRAGAGFVATNDDATFPGPDGLLPGAGSILAAIERSSGRRAEVMGKPHKPMMEAAARRLAGARHIAVVGDRAETDLAGGAAMGWTTVLVLSGVTAPENAAAVTPAPDVVLDSIADLATAL